MDYTNFFDFGVDAGDAQLNTINDGSSPPISLSTPIRFFERSQSTLYVSWLHILSPYVNVGPFMMILFNCSLQFTNLQLLHYIYIGGNELPNSN